MSRREKRGTSVTTYELASLVIQFLIAVGTIGAVVVALRLASKSAKPVLSVIAGASLSADTDVGDEVWDGIFIEVTNKSGIKVQIESVLFRWANKAHLFAPIPLTSEDTDESAPKNRNGQPPILCEIGPLEMWHFDYSLDEVIRALEMSYVTMQNDGLSRILPNTVRRFFDYMFRISPVAQIDVIGGDSINVELKDFLTVQFRDLIKRHPALPRDETRHLFQELMR